MIWLALPFLLIPQVHHFKFQHSRAAQELARKYERAVASAQSELLETIERHNRTLLKELQRVLEEETKAGRLDAALEVRNAIRTIEEGFASRHEPDPYDAFLGTWHVQYQNGNTHSFEISRGKGRRQFVYREFARVIDGKPSGPIDIRRPMRAEGGFLLLKGRSSCNRFHVANGMIYVEHWPHSPTPRGVAPGVAVGQTTAGKRK